MKCEQQYIDLFNSQRPLIDTNSSDVINSKRQAAYDAFCRIGLPTQKEERYKYTDIRKLFEPDYGLNLARISIPVETEKVFRCDIPSISRSPFFVVNDVLYPQNIAERGIESDRSKGGIVVASLREYSAEHPDFVEKYYGKIAKTDNDGITALNTMLAQDGLLVYVPKGVRLKETIQVINILRSDVNLMVNRRVLIVIDDDAEARFLFCDHAADDRDFLSTQVVEVYVGERSLIELYCMEETHYKNKRISNLYIEQQRDSRVVHNSLTLHNGLSRNRTDVAMIGEGGECLLNGCVIADRHQHVDNNTLIDHRVANCTSRQLYKYVLDEQAVGAFAGRILVRKGADNTSSQETNQNLLAKDTARMFTQPELEIYADDVKCAHGSTVGQLNDAALFYMRQRGIPLKEARLLLETAFVGEVIDSISLAPLRDRLHYLVEKRFRGELNKCVGCKMCQ